MSVVVIGMEMPTNCALCDCSFGALCYVSPAEVNGYCPGHSRPEWCQLVDLPEKHGRLIDANQFEKDYEVLYNLNYITNSEWILFRELLKNQKTIVEAERE